MNHLGFLENLRLISSQCFFMDTGEREAEQAANEIFHLYKDNKKFLGVETYMDCDIRFSVEVRIKKGKRLTEKEFNPLLSFRGIPLKIVYRKRANQRLKEYKGE